MEQNSIINNNINIIVSSYNEEDNIIPFFKEITKYIINLNYYFNIIYINDGSTDKTFDNINFLIKNFDNIIEKDINNIKISLISYKENHGHEYAMIKGIFHSDAKYIIALDCDLQHPPQLIPQMIEALEDGYDAILMKRIKNLDAGFIRSFTSKMYYKFINIIKKDNLIEGVSDFFAFNNQILQKIKKIDKNNIYFIRRTIQKLSKNSKVIPFVANKRYSGHSHYRFFDLVKLAIRSLKN